MRLAPFSYFCTCWNVRPRASASVDWDMPSLVRRRRSFVPTCLSIGCATSLGIGFSSRLRKDTRVRARTEVPVAPTKAMLQCLDCLAGRWHQRCRWIGRDLGMSRWQLGATLYYFSAYGNACWQDPLRVTDVGRWGPGLCIYRTVSRRSATSSRFLSEEHSRGTEASFMTP
jgi:hypothetical protein